MQRDGYREATERVFGWGVGLAGGHDRVRKGGFRGVVMNRSNSSQLAILLLASVAVADPPPTPQEALRPGGIEIGYHTLEGLGAVPVSDDAGEWPTAWDQLQEFVAAHPGLAPGWHEQATPGEYLVATGTASIASAPEMPIGSARRLAFERARFNAMQQIAQQAGAVAEARSLIAEQLVEAGDREAAERFFEDRFSGAAPRDLGLASDRVAILEGALATAAGRTDRRIAGVQVYKVFEGPEDLAVLATWSPETRRVVEAILDPCTAVRGKAGQPAIADWARAIGDSLLYTHGAQVRTDERGELCVVAFGQREMLGSHPRFRELAAEQAAKDAELELRRFLAALHASEFGMGTTAGAIVSGEEGRAAIRERWEQTLSGAIEQLELPIPPVIHRAEFVHPRSANGRKTICVVICANVSSLAAQDRLRRWLSGDRATGTETEARGFGGQGISGERP